MSALECQSAKAISPQPIPPSYNGFSLEELMGIRFYCPNGHKLNVKEFQAGRRGICPFCGARIQIPTQSTRPSAKGRQGGAAVSIKDAKAADFAKFRFCAL